MTRVAWPVNDDGSIGRGFWDQHLVERLLAGMDWRPPGWTVPRHVRMDDPDGADVLVLPARWWAHRAGEVADTVAGWDDPTVILTGDEEAKFPWEALDGVARLWVQTPMPGVHDLGRVVGFGDGPAPHVTEVLDRQPWPDRRPHAWTFRGQVLDNSTRQAAAAAVAGRDDGLWEDTGGFGQGLPGDVYAHELAATRWALAPSGPFTPDTFRCFEALHAGAVPIVDETPHTGRRGDYWSWLFGEVPWPVLDDWAEVHQWLDGGRWPELSAQCGSWWPLRLRDLAYRMHGGGGGLTGLVTVVVSTSPIPSHPDPTITWQTLDSLDAAGLGGCDTLVLADGVRPEQSDRADDYHGYLSRLGWEARRRPNTAVCYDGVWRHQAGTLRRWLPEVRTPYVLFVEHDTPLRGHLPWDQLLAPLRADVADVIRLHHEDVIPEPHEPMMVDPGPTVLAGLPVRRTFQWSQRPHLAASGWYADVLVRYFGTESRTMVEDCLHGVVHNTFTRCGEWAAPWRLAIYHPDGGICRSWHTDGRAGEPKWDMRYAYDDGVPVGAPNPVRDER